MHLIGVKTLKAESGSNSEVSSGSKDFKSDENESNFSPRSNKKIHVIASLSSAENKNFAILIIINFLLSVYLIVHSLVISVIPLTPEQGVAIKLTVFPNFVILVCILKHCDVSSKPKW